METHLALFKYMNSLGSVPQILAGDEDVIKYLNENNVTFENITDLPEQYDIFISLTTSTMPFARYWLEKSLAKDKVNIWLYLSPIAMNSEIEALKPTHTRFLHAVCAADKRTIDNCKRYNREVLYLNTGSPSWDYFSTRQFYDEVSEIKGRYGDKLLLLGIDCEWNCTNDGPMKEYHFVKEIIDYAGSRGFQTILQVHPNIKKIPGDLHAFINPGYYKYPLYAASSHVIGSILSTLVSECLFLDKKIGTKLLGISKDSDYWGQFHWFDEPEQWYNCTLPLYGKDYLDMIPLIHNDKTLEKFLSSNKNPYSTNGVKNIFGWPEVPSFIENVFKTIESYFAGISQENFDTLMNKSNFEKNLLVDFMWEGERKNSPIAHITDLKTLIDTATYYLNQSNVGAAQICLRRAEMLSGTEHFDFVQYALAVCFYMGGNLTEARKYIYKSLMVKPNLKQYQDLSIKIDTAIQANAMVTT
jgi:hypothetical protein